MRPINCIKTIFMTVIAGLAIACPLEAKKYVNITGCGLTMIRESRQCELHYNSGKVRLSGNEGPYISTPDGISGQYGKESKTPRPDLEIGKIVYRKAGSGKWFEFYEGMTIEAKTSYTFRVNDSDLSNRGSYRMILMVVDNELSPQPKKPVTPSKTPFPSEPKPLPLPSVMPPRPEPEQPEEYAVACADNRRSNGFDGSGITGGHNRYLPSVETPYLGVKLKFGSGSAYVTEVQRGYAAYNAGILPGDWIEVVGTRRISSLANLKSALKRYSNKGKAKVYVYRNGQLRGTTVRLYSKEHQEYHLTMIAWETCWQRKG